MFGQQKPAFGTPATGFSSTPAFGAAAPATFGTGGAFGATSTAAVAPAFGSQTQSTGGLFGAAQPQQAQQAGGGLFGQQGGSAFGTATSTAFGSTAGSAFGAFNKPAGSTGFGTTGFGTPASNSIGTGLFGAPATTSTGLFGAQQQQQQPSAFGSFGSTTGSAFVQPQSSVVGTTVKFNMTVGTDTMLKSGVTTNINTRHQCITCMKEYENKSLEELRCEDYLANRKGPANAAGGNWFNAPPNQSAVASTGGFFGSAATPASTQNTIFGAQKPLFGSTTGGFGAAPTSTFGTSTFGATSTTGAGTGLFGSKPPGFGTSTTSTGGFGFGAGTSTAAGTMFGTQQQKPLGFGAPTSQPGGLFGSTTTTGFGAPASQPSAFGAAAAPAFGTAPAAQNTSIGLFGQQQNKPAFGGFGTTATSSAAPAFGASTVGGFGAATSQANMFGAQNKAPAFGGFGTQTSTVPAFGFGANAQTQQAGGLFGAAKPALSFGQSTSQPATGFGGFGTTNTATGGGLFGANAQNKPGGLFGSGTTGFGTTGTAFGSTNPTGFGSTGLGSSFGTTNTSLLGGTQPFQPLQQQQQQQAQSALPNAVEQRLYQLLNSPYGDNPLFKNLSTDPAKHEDILKPINPVAQKALVSDNQYKISPHRNIKPALKPVYSVGSCRGKGAIFDGLEDDDINPSDVFVPRQSVKRLVLKPKSSGATPTGGSSNRNKTSSPAFDITTTPGEEESFSLPAVKQVDKKNVNPADDSFDGLNVQKKLQQPQKLGLDKSLNSTSADVSSLAVRSGDDLEENEESADPPPAGVVLKRHGYYTIPPLSELSGLINKDSGACVVENFTVGRTGYGNIFFPGELNVAGLDLDSIVFIRHKEVIVYPDDSKKPPLGEGLNRKAQITLDKVWPVDKTSKNWVRSPEKLSSMGYEERLQRTCLKLGAQFVEYRMETGSWVFKVDHFSKYGLADDSDEDEQPVQTRTGEPKKLKTLQLRESLKMDEIKVASAPPPLSDSTKITTIATVHNQDKAVDNADFMEEGTDVSKDVVIQVTPPAQTLTNVRSTASNKVKMMKATLFDDDEDVDEMESESVLAAKPRPVILQSRPTILERRDPLVEDIAHTMLTGSSGGRGLGGSFDLNHPAPSAASSLLRTRFLTHSGGGLILDTSRSEAAGQRKQIYEQPHYSLQAAYDNFVELPTTGPRIGEARTVVPRFLRQVRPSEESLFTGRLKCLADGALAAGRHFRVGWASSWAFAHAGRPSVGEDLMNGKLCVSLERVQVCPHGYPDEQQLRLLESWLELSLENSSVDGESTVPRIIPDDGVESLHAHAREASKQVSDAAVAPESFGLALKETKRVWDLCVALWGRLHDQEEDMATYGQDTHEVTMQRKEAFSTWLEEAVAPQVAEDVRRCREDLKPDPVNEVLALLSGNRLAESCTRAQENGDYYAALLMATGGASNSHRGQLVLQQLERWQEMKADEFIRENRLRLYALLGGTPMWLGSRGTMVNVFEGLDWKRALGLWLWHLTSPVASIGDAFLAYEDSFSRDENPCATAPVPEYTALKEEAPCDMRKGPFDIKYHLLKLYTDRSHSLECVLDPETHTSDPLDYSLSWLLAQVLCSLGYKSSMSRGRMDHLHASFAAQLESLGLWHWATYALLHLDDDSMRRERVRDVLGRHVLPGDEDSAEREEFLRRHLCVPAAWIAEAKAAHAGANGNAKDQAWYLTKAGDWGRAHEVIMRQIGPDAIINDDCELLKSLLTDMGAPGAAPESVSGWPTGGQVILDFLNLDSEVRKLLRSRQGEDVDDQMLGYKIEGLRPRVTSLCARVASLSVRNAKERLCQSEIAKRTAHLMRAILSLDAATEQTDSVGGVTNVLAQHLSQLPMPDDYALQELRVLTRSYMKELMEG